MKRIISLILCLTFLACSLTAFAASFTDFDDSHWAASYVNELVADGTINGFEDGSFRPSGTVTRAEFVKMIGKGPDRAPADFADVPKSHWAYEYIMTSGLDPVYDNTFMPSQPITRGEVATLLWKRAGSPLGITAPPIINSQGKNRDAISWVYTNSIMTGDDNINLRLADTLTRAEAAALIVRSRKVNDSTAKTNFYDAASPEVFKAAYDAFGFVDKEYSESATLTNGELAMAAARIVSDQYVPDYPGVSASKSFDHQYAQALNMLCRYYLSPENDNAEYIEKNATIKDAVLALAFATFRSSNTPVQYDESGKTYSDAGENSDFANTLLKISYQNGISVSGDMKLNANKEVSLKEFSCLLLQFDGISGLYTFNVTGSQMYDSDGKLNTNIACYPSNFSSYKAILSDIPSYVYEKPFINALELPSESYNVTNALVDLFNTMFTQWHTYASANGVKITITSTPVLSVASEYGYTFRVKLKINSLSGSKCLGDIIKCSDSSIALKSLSVGEEFWLDVNTGSKLTGIAFPFDKVFVNQLL